MTELGIQQAAASPADGTPVVAIAGVSADSERPAVCVIVAGGSVRPLRAVKELDILGVWHQAEPPLMAAVLAGGLARARASPDCWSHLVVILDIHVKGRADLFHIGKARRTSRLRPCLRKYRKQYRRKNGDNRNDNQ